jgi:hypothetical protein
MLEGPEKGAAVEPIFLRILTLADRAGRGAVCFGQGVLVMSPGSDFTLTITDSGPWWYFLPFQGRF